MHLSKAPLVYAVILLGMSIACSDSSTPTAPPAGAAAGSIGAMSSPNGSGLHPAGTASLTDPVTLKVTAPVAQSPVNDAKPQTSPVTLVASASTGKFATPTTLQYRFLVIGPTGAVVQDSGLQPKPSFDISASLELDKRHTWVVRAEANGSVGPWSTAASFIAPAGGYISGSELYDPLINGTTVGKIVGPVTFIKGVGARMESEASFIEYELPVTLVEGEMSALVTGLAVISQHRRPEGSGHHDARGQRRDQRQPLPDERRQAGQRRLCMAIPDRTGRLHPDNQRRSDLIRSTRDLLYFVKATWFGGFFNVEWREGGVNGTTIYSYGKPYSRQYTPSPHMVFAGNPYYSGDRGDPATVEGMVIRQLWVSGRPRPAGANQ